MLGNFNLKALENAQENVMAAIAVAREKTEKLVAIPHKTYMNFVRALMDIDVELNKVMTPIFHLDSVNNSDVTKQIMEDILPITSAYSTDMAQHIGVYNGYKYVRDTEYDKLNNAQKKLVDDTIRDFEISGINLPDDQKKRIKEIDAEMSKLSNDFSNNVIAANKNFKIKVTDETVLGEMPQSDKDAAATEDGWGFSLLDPMYVPFMKFVTDRKLRKQMHDARYARAPENMDIIVRMLELRAQASKILGYENYAELTFEDRSAPSVQTVKDFLSNLKSGVASMVARDRAELSARAAQDGVTDFAPSDAAFYGRLVQQEQYSVDASAVREYFELNATVNGMFDIISEIFEIKFAPRDVPLWHADAKYFDVVQDGKIIAGFFIDLTNRESKSPGAWMMEFEQHYTDANGVQHLPEIINVANFPAATTDTPSLLTTDNISTMFHEMGHGLHGLLTKVPEYAMAGTNVDRDVVEFPSMFWEYFWKSPAVLKRIAKHYKTGASISDDMIEKIIKADNFMQGTDLDWITSYSLFDMEIHTKNGLNANDIKAMFESLVPKDMITSDGGRDRPLTVFLHPFAHDYAAGYYSYLWAEQLAADAYLAMDKNPFNITMMRKYRDTVLALGGTKKMSEIYIDFMGRAPNPDSLLQMYGLK